ncbi:response regulator receiver [Methylorubrum extorquens DSM 13060]|uniref:Response regulator receiver protein CpdR n=2 Tax=Methylobacteriaceae TaxID=119045 RepID=A0A564FS61_9HYPH|nr:response regulator receiver [Methylorubrum extorquens DSM 13060]GJD55732.1 Response regulator receiver protein CpdR [Methylobacterium dankookense]VUF11005.1 Response regulator receiver protein CpdR [Methylobacterium dankookense]
MLLEGDPGIGTLFTDIDMPGSMDGIALAARVAERWPHIRLVVTSGRACMQDGDLPDHGRFLSKPYHRSDLVDVIARAA